MRSGDAAWLTVAAGICVYEFAAALNRAEYLTHACDRYRASKPLTTYLVIAYLAGHLARVWPRRLDPLSRLADRRPG